MNTLLTIILWLFISLWILEKREWYKNKLISADSFSKEFYIFMSVLFMPINLTVIFFNEFIFRKWNN